MHVQVYPGQTALVVSLENITENVYLGNQRSMTITNCLFRLGGAAALLSNKRRHWWTARSACFDAHVLVLTWWDLPRRPWSAVARDQKQ